MYQWPVTISKNKSRCQTAVKSHHHPLKPQSGLKGHGCFCTFKIKVESQNLDHGCIKDQWPYPNQDQDTKPQAGTFKAPNKDLNDMDILCTLEIEIESHNLDYRCIKDQWPYPNQDQDTKPQSGTSSALQSSKWELKGLGCSLHLLNIDREPKFRSWLYQRAVTISKWRSICQTPIRNLQHPQKPQIRT